MSLLPDVKTPPPSPRPRLLRLALRAAAIAASGIAIAHGQTSPDTADAVPTSRAQAYAEFRRLYEAGDHVAAVEKARTVVELTERSAAPGAKDELQVALMNLGIAQFAAGDYVGAESSYQRVIDMIEGTGRMANSRLARATAGLANTYYAAKRYDLAVPTFERAVLLSRRTGGLFNEEQLPLLEKQADSLTELGHTEDALQARRYALRLIGRRHGEQSLAYAHELESVGRWYSRVRAYDASRYTLRRALDTIEDLEGEDSLESIGPLTAIGDNARRWLRDPSSRDQANPDQERAAMFHDPVLPAPLALSQSTIAAEGLRALEQAATIADTHPDTPPATVAAVRTQLGDWYQSQQQPERALPHYRMAWIAATRAGPVAGAPLVESLFGQPVLLRYYAPDNWDRYAQRPPEEAEQRMVELELTVTDQGETRDPRVVSDAGDPKLGQQTLRAAESASYRPRFANGEPVETENVRFVQPFFVLRSDGGSEAPAGAAPGAPEPSEPDGTSPPAQGTGGTSAGASDVVPGAGSISAGTSASGSEAD
jgi:tetratricopeptide (TPR) repeat protein